LLIMTFASDPHHSAGSADALDCPDVESFPLKLGRPGSLGRSFSSCVRK
jgi:hypothetical protein